MSIKSIVMSIIFLPSAFLYAADLNTNTPQTNNFGWNVRQVVASGYISPRTKYTAKIDRQFLGETPEGYYKVQEFYIEIAGLFDKKNYPKGTAYTEPYILINKDDVTRFQDDLIESDSNEYKPSIHGPYIRYRDNGSVDVRGQYDHGKKMGYWYYYSGDKLYLTELYDNDILIQEIQKQ